jgi:glycine reductase
MHKNWRVIHYINQFFAGIGSEDKARTGLFEKQGAIGPGVALQKAIEGRGTLVATLYCGDDYFVENQEETLDRALEMVMKHNPDVLIAGPAFNAGRYGQACGALCSLVQSRLGIPAVTGMYPENPGADLFRKDIYIVETPQRVKEIPVLLTRMLELGIKLAKKEPIGPAQKEGYIPRGMKKNTWVKQTAAERAADMLLSKLAGRPFNTEIKSPKFDMVPPPPPLKDLKSARIAFVTDGGIVPVGNPDAMPAASGKVFAKYPIAGLDQMSPETFECIHAGMNKQISAADPNRMVPLDVMRELNKAGEVGKLHDWLYSTSGCTVEYENAVKMGREIAKDLLKSGVTAVILSSA